MTGAIIADRSTSLSVAQCRRKLSQQCPVRGKVALGSFG